MIAKRYLVTALFAMLSIPAAATQFSVQGIPQYTNKRIEISGQPRLLDAVSALAVPATVYSPGTSLCRTALRARHQAIKQSLLRDILRMRERMSAFGNYRMRHLVNRLGEQLERLPVSGCRRMPLDYDVITAHPIWNLPLQDGDLMHFPARPESVVIAGAVDRERLTAYAGGSVAHYLSAIKRTDLANTDIVWVVQADGSIDTAPVAYWNRDFHPVTPGAIIIVPVKDSIAAEINPEFNRYLAELYATQKVLP